MIEQKDFDQPQERSFDRFVFIHPHFKFGGAENQTLLVMNGLAAQGFPCVLILHKKIGGLLARLDQRVRIIELGFEAHALLPIGAARLVGVLNKLPPSLIVTRLWSSILMVGSVAALVRQHRYLYYEDLDPRDHEQFVAAGALKKHLIARIFRKNKGSLIANSHHVSEAMATEYGLFEKPRVIECGVDVAECQTMAQEEVVLPTLTSEAIRLVTVGSLVPIKGLLELREVLENAPFPVQWVLVGDGVLREKLERPSANSNLTIVMTGAVANPYPYIVASQALLHGGLSESFGVVIIEALALGIPVIAHSSNGPREISMTLPGKVSLVNVSQADTIFQAAALLDTNASDAAFPADGALGPYSMDRVLQKWVNELC